MRYSEIIEAAANLPTKYEIDPDTDLAMNLPNQWSQSPYLGAVKAKSGSGYIAQIHIPQAIWTSMVDQNPAKWSNAPASFFNETGNQRIPMIVGRFADPRQAAWYAQEVLFGGDIQPKEIIEDYFDEKYNDGDGSVWRGLKQNVPAFEGTALTAADEAQFFATRGNSPEAVQKKNTDEYNRAMPAKIKKAMYDLFSHNRDLAKKRLGFKGSLEQLKVKIDQLVDQRGVDFFMTAPGSVKMKDLASLKF